MMPIKIGFVLLSASNCPIPSTRISVLNMFPYLREASFDPHIVFDPVHGNEMPELDALYPYLVAEEFQLVYFQKVHGSSAERLAKQLSEAGIKTIYGVCDLVDVGMTAATDLTIVVTDYLKSLYPLALQSKIEVVHDGIEHPEIYKAEIGKNYGSKAMPLNAVLVTSAHLDSLPILKSLPDWLRVTIVGNYPAELNKWLSVAYWKIREQHEFRDRISYLRFLLNRRISCLAWDPLDVYQIMQRADIGIIPIHTDSEAESAQLPASWKVKSENRLTMKMCVGLPVVATPIPSYLPVINQGKNGFLANSGQEWFEYLQALRDPELRWEIGTSARSSVVEKYSTEKQADCLIKALKKLR